MEMLFGIIVIVNMLKVEVVQCRSGKVISELRDKPYHEGLQRLNLYSMAYRRKRRDIILVFKILQKIDRIEASNFFIQAVYKQDNETRTHSMKQFKLKFESDL